MTRTEAFAPRRRAWARPLGLAGSMALIGAIALLAVRRDPGSAAAPGDGNGTPVLRVDRTRIDLGDVPLGQWTEAIFVVRNEGTGTLRFVKPPHVEVAAGC